MRKPKMMKEILTLVLFNDHKSPKAFKVSHLKISLATYLTLAVIFVTLFLAAYSTWKIIKIKKNPNFIQSNHDDLEQKIIELQSKNIELENRLSNSTKSDIGKTPSSFLFSALPQISVPESGLPKPETLAFKIEKPSIYWKNNSLFYSSAIVYQKEDGTSQQGRFILLARGSHYIIAYPDLALSISGDSILQPDLGEYFSVTRYRELKASFGPVQKTDDIQAIDLLIFDQNKKLIFVERYIVPRAQAIKSPSIKETPKQTPVTSPTGEIKK